MRISLPATSANLGPGFDAAGLALSMHLTIEAHAAPGFQIQATGRDAALCSALEHNLILDTYREVLDRAGAAVLPLHLKLHNEIPLGMGCGSSAAALLAGVALADHFGGLHGTDTAIVAEASRIEGHPDNVAACWYGGFTVSAAVGEAVEAATFGDFAATGGWELLLAVQPTSLATKKARALLPDSYSKADAIFNVQRTALLVAAFAQGRPDLLATAMQDRMHQPYRAEACPLLKTLLPLMQEPEIAGVALSGAGPSVLLFLAPETTLLEAETRIQRLVGPEVELLPLRISGGAERTLL
ncbi:MAG: homoserine kinase [Acidobacteriaceae bacterium]